MIHTLFAHAGEDHNSTVQSAAHVLESAPLAFFVWVCASIAILLIFMNIFKMKRPERLLGLAAFNLFYGVFMYDKSALVGAIVLSIGFGMTLWSVIIGLQDDTPPSSSKTKKKD